MLQEAGRRVPPLLAVMRDVMLADLDTSLGQPHAALKLLRSYRTASSPSWPRCPAPAPTSR